MEIDMEEYVSKYHKMTDDLRKQIAAMWEDGKTSSFIAAQLGITRNSAIGVVYRLREKGIISREHSEKRKLPKKPIKQIIEKPKKIIEVKEKKEKPVKIILEKVIDDPVINEYFNSQKNESCNMEDLKYYSCRFIVEEGNYETTKYCGKKITRSSYCAEHYGVCYHPPRYALKNLLNV